MLIRKPSDISSSAITPQDEYLNRRRFLRGAGAVGIGAAAAVLGGGRIADVVSPRERVLFDTTKLETVKSPLTTTGEQRTSFDDITRCSDI